MIVPLLWSNKHGIRVASWLDDLDRCDVRHRRISKTALMLAIEGSRSASKKQEHR